MIIQSHFQSSILNPSFPLFKLFWIQILTTLSNRTNASPVYLILFISATYVLNRPCVYCSLLLAILVLALFDFSASGDGGWFEPRYSLYSLQSLSSTSRNETGAGNATLGAVEGAVSLLANAVNVTAGMAMDAALGASRKGLEEGGSSWESWIRRVWRSGLRIDCLGVTIRL